MKVSLNSMNTISGGFPTQIKRKGPELGFGPSTGFSWGLTRGSYRTTLELDSGPVAIFISVCGFLHHCDGEYGELWVL